MRLGHLWVMTAWWLSVPTLAEPRGSAAASGHTAGHSTHVRVTGKSPVVVQPAPHPEHIAAPAPGRPGGPGSNRHQDKGHKKHRGHDHGSPSNHANERYRGAPQTHDESIHGGGKFHGWVETRVTKDQVSLNRWRVKEGPDTRKPHEERELEFNGTAAPRNYQLKHEGLPPIWRGPIIPKVIRDVRRACAPPHCCYGRLDNWAACLQGGKNAEWCYAIEALGGMCWQQKVTPQMCQSQCCQPTGIGKAKSIPCPGKR